MKKKRKKQLKEIKKQKARLERDLKTFLDTVERATVDEEDQKWITFENLQNALFMTNFEREEMEDISIHSEICPSCIKLDSTRAFTIAIAILYTVINYEIYDKRSEYSPIPDELMNQITEFKDLLEEFLFS